MRAKRLSTPFPGIQVSKEVIHKDRKEAGYPFNLFGVYWHYINLIFVGKNVQKFQIFDWWLKFAEVHMWFSRLEIIWLYFNFFLSFSFHIDFHDRVFLFYTKLLISDNALSIIMTSFQCKRIKNTIVITIFFASNSNNSQEVFYVCGDSSYFLFTLQLRKLKTKVIKTNLKWRTNNAICWI